MNGLVSLQCLRREDFRLVQEHVVDFADVRYQLLQETKRNQ